MLFNVESEYGRTPLRNALQLCDFRFVELFRDTPQSLIEILTESIFERNEYEQRYVNAISYCRDSAAIELVFDVLNDNKMISKFFSAVKMEDFDKSVKDIAAEWKDYLKFDESLTAEFDISSIGNYKTNVFGTACKYGKFETIKRLFDNIKNNKTQTLMKLLSDKDSSKYEETVLMKVVCSKYNTKMLELLLLNNPYLSDKQKYTLLSIEDKTGANTLMKSTDDCASLILNSSIVNDKHDKIKLINSNICLENNADIYVLLPILNCIKDDQRQLKEILSRESTQKSLYNACKYPNKSDIVLQIIEYFATDPKQLFEALSYVEKEYHFNGHFYNGYNCLMNVAEFQSDGKVIKLLLQLMNKMDYESQNKLLMIKDTEDNETFIFKIKHEKDMKAVFTILNNDMIETLLTDKNEQQLGQRYGDWRTVQQKWRDMIRRDDVYSRDFLEPLLTQYIEYLEFDKVLNAKIDVTFGEYVTNPFMVSCMLGKRETILKLLDCIKNDKEKIKLLLLHNWNEDNYNNCLMELAENMYNEIIIDILNFLDANNFNHIKYELLSMEHKNSGITVLVYLCKNNSNFETIQTIISNISDSTMVLKLLNLKDNNNRTCFDYAKPNILSFIQTYSK